MKKTKIITSFLAVLLIFCSLFTFVGCAEYDWCQEGDFEIGYCEKTNDAFLGTYVWRGHLGEDMDIVLPNTYNGAPITALGGYCGLGVPTPFGIYFAGTDDFDSELCGDSEASLWSFYCDYYVNTQAKVYANLKDRLERYYETAKDFEIVDLVFNLHIGSNLKEIVEIQDNEMKCLILNETDENEVFTVYAFSFFITVDENNKYFYSDDLGRMYFKENNKLVKYFLYHNRESFPEHSL